MSRERGARDDWLGHRAGSCEAAMVVEVCAVPSTSSIPVHFRYYPSITAGLLA
jgi:hypothetical protein